MDSLRDNHQLKRFALVFSALFAFALAIAQPHRVHHVFENTEHTHNHGDADSSHSDHSKKPVKAPQTECVVQSISQHCFAIPVALVKTPLIALADETYRPVLSFSIHRFISSPFSQRAPPAVSSSYSI